MNPSSPEKYARKKLAKQGLHPRSPGQAPKIDNEQVFGSGSDVQDPDGRKIGSVTRASGDTNGPDPTFHPSVLADMVSKYGEAVKKFAGDSDE